MPKILLTSTCRPFGAEGDAPSVGYELLHGQVTRAQGLFSPRALHLHFSLEYIAENLDSPAVVLQYPSREELIRELKKGYDYVGVSFLLAVFHKMKETVALIRKHSPRSKIVLGGYGTVLKDEVLLPFADHVCREEGVAYFRRLLGESPAPTPYRHPLIVSRLKIFSLPVSKTGMIFAGLGCANGCDFCCTSHFFKRRHIKLLPEGKDIHDVVRRYLDVDPDMSFVVLDEDFLLNKRRALEFRDCVLKDGRPISMFVFSSIRAISQYTTREIMEMGIDGFWIGYEGTRSGYAKQQGRAAEELLPDLRAHGVSILASMIVGFDYQDPDTVARELEGLLRLRPSLCQFLIYGPTPGTPFYERIMREGLLHEGLVKDPERYYRSCDGFAAMVRHPRLSPAQIEGLQRRCFDEDFRRLGPSVFRVVEAWLNGRRAWKGSESPFLSAKAARFAREARKSYPIFLAGRLLGPSPEVRAWIGRLERAAWAELGKPTLLERLLSVAALGAAAWTSLCLRLKIFQHPRLTRTAYRVPARRWRKLELWESLPVRMELPGLSVRVELQHARKRVWLRLEGALASAGADRLWESLRETLAETGSRLVLDLKGLRLETPDVAAAIAAALGAHRRRIRLVLPSAAAQAELMILTEFFRLYRS